MRRTHPCPREGLPAAAAASPRLYPRCRRGRSKLARGFITDRARGRPYDALVRRAERGQGRTPIMRFAAKLLALLAPILFIAIPARGEAEPGVRDDAKFFSPDAVRKATDDLK